MYEGFHGKGFTGFHKFVGVRIGRIRVRQSVNLCLGIPKPTVLRVRPSK